jgi:hypothetical protein
MADAQRGPKETASILSKLLELFSNLRLFLNEVRQNFLEYGDRLLRRLEYLFFIYLWVSIGLLLLVLGLFFMIIDYAQVSRGIVFTIGGAIIFLTALIFLQTAKIKKYKK